MDDSERARAALEHAFEAFGDARVTVLHVIDPLGAAYGGDETPSDPSSDPAFFDDVERIAAEHDAGVETIVREGTAAEAILAYVEEEPVDGIVMGSEGRSGVSRMLLGSVAEAVTRQSPVPVTIVPARDRSVDD